MSTDLTVLNSATLTMNSLEISELVGSRHDSVKRTIERLTEQGVISQPPTVDGPQSANGVVVQVYLFSGPDGKRDSIVVVAQLSPEFTGRLVDRWQELESQVSAPQTYLAALKALVASEEAKAALIAQAALDAPRVALARAFTGDVSLFLREWVALMKDEQGLGAKEKQVHAYLIARGYLYREPVERRLRAYAQHDRLFKLAADTVGGYPRVSLKITGEGIEILSPIVLSHFDRG